MTRLAVAAAAVCGLAAAEAAASVVAVGGGFQSSYAIDMAPGTSSGSDVGSVFIFEWNGSLLNVAAADDIAGHGVTTLSHVLPFAPTSALIFGVVLGQPGLGDGKDHIYSVVNNAFADASVGLKWSQAFPGASDATRMRHDVFVPLLVQADAGDAAALAAVTAFALGDALAAAFDPNGPASVLEWTISLPPIGRIPEPAVLGLFGVLVAGLGALRRKPSAG